MTFRRAVLVALLLALPASTFAQFQRPSGIDDIDVSEPTRGKKKVPPKKAEPSTEDEPQQIDETDVDPYVPGRPDRRREKEREKEELRDNPLDAKSTLKAPQELGDKKKPDAKDLKDAKDPKYAKDAKDPKETRKDAVDPRKPDQKAPAGAVEPGKTVPAVAAPELRELILPPRDGEAQLMQAWADRLTALRAHNYKTAQEDELKIVKLRAELGYENLFQIATALAHESETIAVSDGTDSLRRAILATELAPALPHAHWAVARAAFSEDKADVGRYVGATYDAFRTSLADPRWRGALLADLAAALLAAFLLAGTASLLLIFGRHFRYFAHDFHHFFPRGAWYAQTTALAVIILALPVVFHAGPFLTLLTLAAAVWMYMSRAERVVIGLFLALLGLVPTLAGLVTSVTTFAGTDAETVYVTERGGLDPPAVQAALKALSEKAAPSFQAVFALGHRARKRGDVDNALALLRRAAELRPSSADALNELANALVLQGDIDGAKETYARAIEHDKQRPEFWINLHRLHARRASQSKDETAAQEISKSQDALRKAMALDQKYAAQGNVAADLHSNKFLMGSSLPAAMLKELASGDRQDERVEDQARQRLLGPLPKGLALLLPAMCVALLLLVGLGRGALRPSQGCAKCGRAVCKRCDGDLATGGLCGQCVVVFARKAVDPPMRVAKEIGIRKYQRRKESAVKLASLMLTGGGHILLGKPGRGVALLLAFAFCASELAVWVLLKGVARAPVGASPGLFKVAPAVIALVLLYLLSVRKAFAHFKSQSTPQSLSQ